TWDTILMHPAVLLVGRNLSLDLAAGSSFVVFVMLAGLSGYLLREINRLGREQAELARLALVAEKTDNAVFLASAEGLIEWINEAFTRVSGHQPNDAIGKQA